MNKTTTREFKFASRILRSEESIFCAVDAEINRHFRLTGERSLLHHISIPPDLSAYSEIKCELHPNTIEYDPN